jgi:hypothetical protein
MDLQILAISDTHLGEDTSFLSFPRGRQHLWQVLRSTLILVGDIPDSALSSMSQTITHTNAFIQTLGSAANIKKGVYVPGNHDHSLWTHYCKLEQGIPCGITGPQGDLIIEDNMERRQPASDHILSVFFGYPDGSSWRTIVADRSNDDKKFNFAIANPLYATRYGQRTYVFTHGTHFKSIVTKRKLVKKLLTLTGIDRLQGKKYV